MFVFIKTTILIMTQGRTIMRSIPLVEGNRVYFVVPYIFQKVPKSSISLNFSHLVNHRKNLYFLIFVFIKTAVVVTTQGRTTVRSISWDEGSREYSLVVYLGFVHVFLLTLLAEYREVSQL